MPDGRWAPVVARAERSTSTTSPPATTIPAGPLHRGGRRRRRRSARARPGPARRLAAARGADQRLAHGENALRCRLLLDTELGERIERVAVFGHLTLSRPVTRPLAATTWRSSWCCPPGSGTTVRTWSTSSSTVRWRPSVPTTRPGFESWRDADRSVARRLDALLAAEEGMTPHEVARAVSRGVPRWAAGRRRLQPDPRPRPDGREVHAVGDRRKVIANRGSRASTAWSRPRSEPPSGAPTSRNLALDGGRDVPASTPRGSSGPHEPRPDHDRRRQRRRRPDLRNARAGRSRRTPTGSTRCSAPRTASTPASLCAATRTPHWKVQSLAELEHALANPNGGIEAAEVRAPGQPAGAGRLDPRAAPLTEQARSRRRRTRSQDGPP